MTIREMKARFSSNKDTLTRLARRVKIRAKIFITIKSPASATQLNEAYHKFIAKCDFLHRAAHQLALVDEANVQQWTASQGQLKPLQKQIKRIYGDAQVEVGVAAQPPETGGVAPGASRVRVQMDPKPWDPTEFRRWRRNFEQYYLGLEMGVINILGQQAVLSGYVTQILNNIYTQSSETTLQSSSLSQTRTKYYHA